MRQLSNLDASFLHLESAETPMHLTTLMVFDQSTAPGGLVTFKQILRTVDERSRAIPFYREELVRVPFNLGNPYWAIRSTFDVEYHVRHIALPQPGDWRQLCIQTARLANRPLDLRRPLWEMTVIEGLNSVEGVAPGAFAIVLKQHHAGVDGEAGMQILSTLLDLEPDPPQREYPEPRVERGINDSVLLARSATDAVVRPSRAINSVLRGLPNARQVISELIARELAMPGRPSAPETRFGGEVSSYRVVEGLPIEWTEINTIRAAVEGATVNDVALAIVGGGLRYYLDSHGELPDASLVTMMPISVRGVGTSIGANQVRTAAVALRTDLADPVERLASIRESTADTKQFAQAIESTHLMDAGEGAIPVVATYGLRLVARVGLTAQSRRLFNTTVTNVPGPRQPVYFCGAELVGFYGFGPLQDGSGLFHAMHGLGDKLFICVTSCREMLPDPGHYRTCLRRSVDDLLIAARTTTKPSSAKPAKPRPTKRASKPRTTKPRTTKPRTTKPRVDGQANDQPVATSPPAAPADTSQHATAH